MNELAIGIDVGTKTGVAVWNIKEKKFEIIETLKIHKALFLVKELKEKINIVRVEDARLRKWFGKNSNSKLQGAGSIKRDSAIWEDFLKDEKINFELVAPKNNMTKVKPEYFKFLTGYNKRISEHARDAAMLVFEFKKSNLTDLF